MNASLHDVDYAESIPVLIVGGGLVGLSMSLFLAKAGISALLVERHPSTAIHPRAMGMTPRTMEFFRNVGIVEAIRRIEPSFSTDNNVLLVESLVGQEFDRLQEDIGDLFNGPVPGSAIAQDLLEPILRARAEELGQALRFSTELLTWEEDEEGVLAVLRERESSRTHTVRTRFLVAADGSKSAIRHQLGIGQHGTGSMGHFISMIFEADLMEQFHQRNAVMCFLSNDVVSAGALVPYPGSAARPDLFRLDVGYEPEGETLADYSEERCLQLIRAATGIPDLAARLKAVLTWEMNALVADRFQQGRIFLVGDAARTQPPSGGLGGNTGIAEAHNLAWKLAAVLRGEAGEELLATYDAERRPLADYTTEQMALLSRQRQHEGSAGITVDPLTVNTGYRYSAGAFVPEEGEEKLPPARHPDQWQGQPGTYAPYLALTQNGKPISTLDLFGSRFVLLAGPDGQSWKAAARRVQETLHIPLDSYQIDGETAELSDTNHTFCAAYGLSSSGAVIIRPDGFIGWRCQSAKGDEQVSEQMLAQALSTLLFR